MHRYLGAESIRHELEQSLRRLQTDYIDLYQTHWQDATTPIAETMGTLLELKAEGKIRAIGVSNASPEQMDEYRAAGPLDADQERYSMLARQMDGGQLAYCDRENISVLAYSPLAQGLLTGKMTPDRELGCGRLPGGGPSLQQDVQRGEPHAHPGLPGRASVRSPRTTAPPWRNSRSRGRSPVPGLTYTLAGARNPAQVDENAGAGDIDLAAEEMAQIDEALAGLKLEL